MRVARFKMEHSYDTHDIYEIGKVDKVRIAIVFDSWFRGYGGIPPQWVRVGEWTIRNNVVCGDSTVSFYAVDPSEVASLTTERAESNAGKIRFVQVHIVDPIRFNKSLRVTIQDLGWRSDGRYLARMDGISSVAYWYQTLPYHPFPKFPSKDQLEIIN